MTYLSSKIKQVTQWLGRVVLILVFAGGIAMMMLWLAGDSRPRRR